MRLIDVDKCPCFKCSRTSNRPCPMWLCDSWCSWLQKTAYDVDKVELLLKAETERINNLDWRKKDAYELGRRDAVKFAIDIVKRGGIE